MWNVHYLQLGNRYRGVWLCLSSASPLQFRSDSHESLKNSLLESDSAFIGEFLSLLAHEECTNTPVSTVMLFWKDYYCFKVAVGTATVIFFFKWWSKWCHPYKGRAVWNWTAGNLRGSHLKSTALLTALRCFVLLWKGIFLCNTLSGMLPCWGALFFYFYFKSHPRNETKLRTKRHRSLSVTFPLVSVTVPWHYHLWEVILQGFYSCYGEDAVLFNETQYFSIYWL